jgi:hypothetical protein
MDPFYKHAEFWINFLVGVGGLVFSYLAFVEAKRAKRAAMEAGRTVKIQTITVELAEIAQKLDTIQPEIYFSEARDLLAEIARRLRRAISPFATDPAFQKAVEAARAALGAARESLKLVRPADPRKEDETPNAVYNGIEGEFAAISSCVADLIGLFEMRDLGPQRSKSVASGDSNAESE